MASLSGWGMEEAEFDGSDRGLSMVGDPELGEDVLDVDLDRACRMTSLEYPIAMLRSFS